jgi:phage head maturation protease
MTKGSKLSKHTLATREEALQARDLIRERLGSDRVLKITSVALTKAQGEGEFVGYAATFDQEPDAQADVIAPGAFTQSIEDWKAREAWPPLLWNHDFQTPA